MTQGWKSADSYHMGLRQETYKVAHAFVNSIPVRGARSQSLGGTLMLHGNIIAARVTREGKLFYSFCMCGYPTKTTLNRLNGVTMVAFGERMFFIRKGKVYFGRDTLLREVDPHETLFIPIDFKPGDKP